MTQTQPQLRTDAELQTAVIEELKWTPSIDCAHIGVTATDGVVTLSGKVDTYPQRLLAERAALRVSGVTAVAEELAVQNEWASRNDTDIAREACEALARAVDVPVDSVVAVVRGHHIVLSGCVPWNFQRDAADRAVRYVKGVFGVSNNVTIRPTVVAADLPTKVRAALNRNAQLAGRDIRVAVDSSKITLEGSVLSSSERRQAETASWAAPGVTDVVNCLQIVS